MDEPQELQSTTESQPLANPSTSLPNQSKAKVVGTALWAVGVTILSNAANIVKQLREVIESVVQLQQFVVDHFWVSAVLLGSVVICGNVLLFRFLYHRLKRRIPTAYKVLVSTACLALVGSVFASNLLSMRSLLRGPMDVQNALISELETTQDIDEGGFRNAVTSAGVMDPWTTAQAVDALLLAGVSTPERLKRAFTYIEAHRRQDGFEVIYEAESKAHFLRTEAAAWVTIAYLKSLSQLDFWGQDERQAAVEKTTSALQMIVEERDPTSRGWSPAPRAAGQARTYATMMAVWALTEALRSPDVQDPTKKELGPPFEAGVAWLINHYEPGLGWEENPAHPLAKRFPGLTYQVLFVLERAQFVPGHNAFRDMAAYKNIKQEFKSTIHEAEITESTSVPTSQIMIGDQSFPVDVLAYPWLLSILPLLIEDQDVPSQDRRYLRGVLQHELKKVPSLPTELLHAETWLVTESLIGLTNVINSQRPK